MEKEQPSRSIKVKIGVNDYEIKFPNNGQLIDIESLKIRMTSSTSKDMIYGAIQAQEAFLMVSAIATFEVLIPSLTKDLLVKTLLELDPIQSKSIIKAYQEYYNWMEQWRKIINEEVADDTNAAGS